MLTKAPQIVSSLQEFTQALNEKAGPEAGSSSLAPARPIRPALRVGGARRLAAGASVLAAWRWSFGLSRLAEPNLTGLDDLPVGARHATWMLATRPDVRKLGLVPRRCLPA